jgi:hypothetical protein
MVVEMVRSRQQLTGVSDLQIGPPGRRANHNASRLQRPRHLAVGESLPGECGQHLGVGCAKIGTREFISPIGQFARPLDVQ